MAEAATDAEQVEYFVGTEVFVAAIKYRKLQGINHAADGIDDTSGQQPVEGFSRQGTEYLRKGQQTYPAHADVQDGRHPFWAGDPEGFEYDSQQSDAPDQRQHTVAQGSADGDKAYRGVGSGNEDEDHHMVHFFQTFVYFIVNVQ